MKQSVKEKLHVMLPLTVGEGVDWLELDGVLRFVHTELEAFISAVLKFSYSDAPYLKKKKKTTRFCIFA